MFFLMYDYSLANGLCQSFHFFIEISPISSAKTREAVEVNYHLVKMI